MEFTKNIRRKYPDGEQSYYKIVGNEIINFDDKKKVAGIYKYELQRNNTLIIDYKGQHIGKKFA